MLAKASKALPCRKAVLVQRCAGRMTGAAAAGRSGLRGARRTRPPRHLRNHMAHGTDAEHRSTHIAVASGKRGAGLTSSLCEAPGRCAGGIRSLEHARKPSDEM
jgi:hypothetical protein